MESSLEKQLVELYLAGADIIGEGLPAPLNRPRAGALETFNLLGIPPRGSGYGDRYHYTDLRNLFQQNTNVISLRPIRRRLWRCRKPKANGFRC